MEKLIVQFIIFINRMCWWTGCFDRE